MPYCPKPFALPMNLILLSPPDFLPNTHRAHLTGRRLNHVLEILKPKLNDTLTVGLENGRVGEGRVVRLEAQSLELEVSLTLDPPAKLPVVLCVALMRPIVLRRVFQTAAAMGVPEIHLFHSRRVEKSFWQSTALRESEIREDLILGLEQAKDTGIPTVHLHKRFKPFVEDVLPGLLEKSKKREARSKKEENVLGIVADPSGEPFSSCFLPDPSCPTRPKALILGPEGGFIPYEVEKFKAAGCRVVSLGQRILRVETAVVAMLAKIF